MPGEISTLSSLFAQTGEKLDNIIHILKKVPYDAEIEYLENSSTTQWINTNISTNSIGDNGRIVIKIKGIQLRTRFAGAINGVYGSSGDICLAFADSKKTDIPYFYGGWKDTTISGFDCLQNDPYTIDFQVSNGSQKLYIDNVLKKQSSSSWTASSTEKNILLFRAQNSYLGKIRIYSCKIYHGNVILCDLVPVRIGTVGYFYDKVSGQLFGNQGTGNFILGPDKA